MNKTITMTKRELFKYETVKEVVDGLIFASVAAKKLGMTRRHVQRLKSSRMRLIGLLQRQRRRRRRQRAQKSRLRSGLIRGWPLLATCSQKRSPRPKNLRKSWLILPKKPRSLPGLFSGMRKNLARLQTLQPSSKSEGLDFFVKLGINKIQTSKGVEKMAKEYELLAVKMPPNVKMKFEEKAKELDLTMSQVARRLVEEWLKDPKKLSV